MKKDDVLLGKKEADKVILDNFINNPPVPIYELIEIYGLSTYVANFDNAEVAGYLDFDQKRIVLSKKDNDRRQTFTAAHELGHWIMHRNYVEENEDIRGVYRKPIGSETDKFEIQANSFAANLLVPDKMLLLYLNLSDQEISDIFKVSRSVIGFRRQNLDV